MFGDLFHNLAVGSSCSPVTVHFSHTRHAIWNVTTYVFAPVNNAFMQTASISSPCSRFKLFFATLYFSLGRHETLNIYLVFVLSSWQSTNAGGLSYVIWLQLPFNVLFLAVWCVSVGKLVYYATVQVSCL